MVACRRPAWPVGADQTLPRRAAAMSTTTFKLYGYRRVVLAGFMLAVAFNQLLWITFAPITGPAAAYYGVSDLSIGLLSMSFMIAYLLGVACLVGDRHL